VPSEKRRMKFTVGYTAALVVHTVTLIVKVRRRGFGSIRCKEQPQLLLYSLTYLHMYHILLPP
jgi:hypothetical protein